MTHWTKLPEAILVQPQEDNPHYRITACPSCLDPSYVPDRGKTMIA